MPENEYLPEASAVVVATVVLPLISVTVAPANAWEVVQIGGIEPGHATIEPLSVAVTVRVTVTICPLPVTVAPLLSVAVIVMVPVYVPGSTCVAVAFTPNELPLPLSVP